MAKEIKEPCGIQKTRNHLAHLFRAKFPFVYISSWEEIRIIDMLNELAKDKELIRTTRDVFVWSSTEGLKKLKETGAEKINGANEPMEALKYIDNYNKSAIFVLKDVHTLLGANGRCPDYNFIRKIRDVSSSLKNSAASKSVVILAPVLALPVELQKDITVVDFELPTLDEIKQLLEEMITINADYGVKINLKEDEKEILCKAAQGLTLQEAENAFARAMVSKGRLSTKELDIILDEKCQVIKKTGILEYIKTDLNMDDIGGLENLKKWLTKRNNSWLKKAQSDYNLPAPKGVLITGVPGCGKSLTAKAMSAMWQLPLLRLDVGKIFSGLIGSSEENMRKAIQTAEAVAPSILWIDEIEKGFASGGAERDGGTSTRVFGTFLTWMAEKTKPVFVIATANNINLLPSEMLRKGRFDEIFFVDLPTSEERKAIFKLHLLKKLKGSISKSFLVTDELLEKLSEKTEGFVGAEIEQAVVSALFEAYFENRALNENDLFKVIENIVPLSTTQSEQIISIRNWANERAVAANAKDVKYNYDSVIEPEDEQQKAKKTKAKETVKKARGGRTIDF